MKRKNILHTLAAKILIIIMLMVFLAVSVLSVVSVAVMLELEVYTVSEDAYRSSELARRAEYDARSLAFFVAELGAKDEKELFGNTNVAAALVREKGAEVRSFDSGKARGDSFTFYYGVTEAQGKPFTVHTADSSEYGKDGVYEITVYLSADLTEKDAYFWNSLAIEAAHEFKYWIYPIGALAIILSVVCYVVLLCVSGKRWGKEELAVPLPIPFDVMLAAAVCALGVPLLILANNRLDDVAAAFILVAYCVLAALVFIGLSMSFALRVKRGKWWEKTLIYTLLRLLARGARGIIRLIVRIPLIWKTALAVACVSLSEFICYALAFPDDEVMLAVFVISKLAIAAALLYVALMLRKLKIAGKRLADGELDHKIALDGLFLDFKEHAVDLNRIGEGMNAAVEQRTKSERMKAELITNVSHDLKTPLTSIINYSDLICREQSENEKINEYAEVLHRQSVRMKRLIEDLVEVSKLSSRSVEVELCECDAAIFVEQLMGEYSQRLSSLSLETIVSAPTEKIKIMADSKKLWRIFDNLMSNICKYAQGGTRVYVSLEDDGGGAKFTFKNISRDPIGVSCEELAERFVRGDASRSTDGNGLGLSIAKNLCELQGGKLDVSVDGDLFKVTVYLPRM